MQASFICTASGDSHHMLGENKTNQNKPNLLGTAFLMGTTKKQLICKHTLSSPIHFIYARVCSSITDGYQGNEGECKLGVDVWEVTYVFHKIFESFP